MEINNPNFQQELGAHEDMVTCPTCKSTNATPIASHPTCRVYKCWECITFSWKVPYFIVRHGGISQQLPPTDGFGPDSPHRCNCTNPLPKAAVDKVAAVLDFSCKEDWWKHSPTNEHIRSALMSIFDYLDCRDEKYLARGAFRILAALDVVGMGEQRRCGWCGGPVDGDYESRGEGEE